MTDARTTQTSLEQWANTNPSVQVTQTALENWVTTSTVTGQAIVTLAALEMWAPSFVPSLPVYGQVNVWNGSAWVKEDVLSFRSGAWDTAKWDVDYWAPDGWHKVPAKVWSGSVWYETGNKPAPPAGPATSILTSYTPGTDRNDFSGAVGVRLGIGTATLNATWLGLRSNGYGGTRTVKIYEWFSGTVQQTVTVDYGSAAAGTWVWKSMPSFAFLANGYYAILMDVTAYDGMVWKNPGPTTYQSPAIVNVYDSYYSGGLATGSINSSFVGIDLGW